MKQLPPWLKMPSERAWNRLFEVNQNHRSLFRLTTNQPQMIAPSMHGDKGIWSDDPRFARVQIELADTLSSLFKPNIDANGFADSSAIIADFQSLRNRSGSYMSPLSIPMMSNRVLADELSLAKGFLSERDERIFKALHSYMFRTIEEAPMAMRKTADRKSVV